MEKRKQKLIKDYIETGNIEKAKEKCKRHFDNPKFVSLYIKLLISEGDYDLLVGFVHKDSFTILNFINY